MSKLPPSHVKNGEPLSPSESARRAARARWGDQRVLRLDQLSPDERRLIQALLDAKRAADEAKAREAVDDAA